MYYGTTGPQRVFSYGYGRANSLLVGVAPSPTSNVRSPYLDATTVLMYSKSKSLAVHEEHKSLLFFAGPGGVCARRTARAARGGAGGARDPAWDAGCGVTTRAALSPEAEPPPATCGRGQRPELSAPRDPSLLASLARGDSYRTQTHLPAENIARRPEGTVDDSRGMHSGLCTLSPSLKLSHTRVGGACGARPPAHTSVVRDVATELPAS